MVHLFVSPNVSFLSFKTLFLKYFECFLENVLNLTTFYFLCQIDDYFFVFLRSEASPVCRCMLRFFVIRSCMVFNNSHFDPFFFLFNFGPLGTGLPGRFLTYI